MIELMSTLSTLDVVDRKETRAQHRNDVPQHVTRHPIPHGGADMPHTHTRDRMDPTPIRITCRHDDDSSVHDESSALGECKHIFPRGMCPLNN